MSNFKPAQRSPFQRVALVGPSGSGKTWSALALAQGKTTLISLENLPPPGDCPVFSVGNMERLLVSLQACKEAGVESVVLDCLSTLWNGPNGLLTEVDRHGDRGWQTVRSELEKLYQAIHGFPGHVIATFRAEEIRLVVEKDGHQRVVSQCGKVEFDKQFGANFHVLLEMSGGTADCKKGPPAAYGRLFPFPGDELARLLFLPTSAPEAEAETTAHPLEPGPVAPSPRSSGGISTQPSEPKLSGQSEKPGSNEVTTVTRLRSAANAALKAGVKRSEVDRVLRYYEGQFAENGALTGMPQHLRDMALGELVGLTLEAEKAAETPWGQK